LIVADDNERPVLDYAPPPPPLKRRDSLEYYREPPISESIWGIRQIVIFIICLAVALFVIINFINRLFRPLSG
jgi:hypothetical protein